MCPRESGPKPFVFRESTPPPIMLCLRTPNDYQCIISYNCFSDFQPGISRGIACDYRAVDPIFMARNLSSWPQWLLFSMMDEKRNGREGRHFAKK